MTLPMRYRFYWVWEHWRVCLFVVFLLAAATWFQMKPNSRDLLAAGECSQLYATAATASESTAIDGMRSGTGAGTCKSLRERGLASPAAVQEMSPQDSILVREITEAVQSFVDAEMAQQLEDAWLALRGCQGNRPVADFVEPTLHAEILDVRLRRDTSIAHVQYLVLGKAWTLDRNDVGSRNVRFSARVAWDTVNLRVVNHDRLGPGLACHYAPIHQDVSQLGAITERLDATSRIEWLEAVEQAEAILYESSH